MIVHHPVPATAETVPETVDAAAEMFKALGNRNRLAILHVLAEHGAARVGDVQAALGLSQSLVSQHLRVLRQARLVAGARRGQEVVYSVRDSHVARIVADALGHMAESLDE